jgi:5-methylcytosine-specific restriction endonuclease McrA
MKGTKKEAIWQRDGYKCHYCKLDMSYMKNVKRTSRCIITVEHLIPKAKGGSNERSNLVTCCEPCNKREGSRLEIIKYRK